MAGLLAKWKRAAAGLQEELGRAATHQEVAGELGLSAKKLKVIRKAIRVYSGAAQEGVGGEGPPLDELAADGDAGPEAALVRRRGGVIATGAEPSPARGARGSSGSPSTAPPSSRRCAAAWAGPRDRSGGGPRNKGRRPRGWARGGGGSAHRAPPARPAP